MNELPDMKVKSKVLDALGQWDDEDWIISAAEDESGVVTFCAVMETEEVDCSNIEVDKIESRGGWITITGKVRTSYFKDLLL